MHHYYTQGKGALIQIEMGPMSYSVKFWVPLTEESIWLIHYVTWKLEKASESIPKFKTFIIHFS